MVLPQLSRVTGVVDIHIDIPVGFGGVLNLDDMRRIPRVTVLDDTDAGNDRAGGA